MRIKTGREWRDEGPSVALSAGFRGALVVGASGHELSREARAELARRRRARQRDTHNAQMRASRVHAPADRSPLWWKSTPICGEWMPRVSMPCARHVGHSDSHRSAITVEAEKIGRRAA